jgi:hypothetical protein
MKVKRFLALALSIITLATSSVTALAAPKKMPDGTMFDAEFYASQYPDVANAVGTSEEALYNHYVQYGKAEGRKPTADAQVVPQAAAGSSFVALKDLANYKSIKKKMTDAEFQQAYDVAVQMVTPLAGLSRQEQLMGVATGIRLGVDLGVVTYSTSAPHYNDPYGYFVTGVGSCAGCTRATGLCLNILGIPYEHVNENKWGHQWCRVPMGDGTYWICDAYGLYCGPEPAPYQHPNVN